MLDTRPFSEAAFRDAFVMEPRNAQLVAANPRVQYLADYLKEVGAKTIVVEDDYIDRNFLEDHAAYYVRCHAQYERKCRRLHFFEGAFEKEALATAALSSSESVADQVKTLVGRYLGFIVVKPLPQSFIGRTCLQTYPERKPTGQRHYNALEPQTVHLLGLKFTVDSMPFQEQDSVVAACATTALWSALQTVGATYDRYRPTPAEITAEASEHPTVFGRNLPSSGLAVPQMIQAIVRYGFEAEVRALDKPSDYMRTWRATRTSYLAELAVAYGNAGLPVIVGHILRCSRKLCKWTGGFHAATVAGFSLKTPVTRPHHQRVNEFYAHDDQAGPFSKLEIVDGTTLRTKFPHKHTVQAEPTIAIIPTYPKIRITYEQARAESQRVTRWLSSLHDSLLDLESETVLEHAVDTYERLRGSAEIRESTKRRILPNPPPRFLWCTTWYSGQEAILEVLLDATDIRPSFYCVAAIVYEAGLGQSLARDIADLASTADDFQSPHASRWVVRMTEAAQDWVEPTAHSLNTADR